MEFLNVTSVEETLKEINKQVTPIEKTEIKLLFDAHSYVVAEDVVARENVPNFARSTVDGYAVRASDTFGASETLPGFLHVVGEVAMGEEVQLVLKHGEAIYVPTGGMIPTGADSVIMIEHCEDVESLLNVYQQVAPKENVIGIAEDIATGDILLSKGTLLRAQEIGAIASQGYVEIMVYKKPVIGYLSSGDEIVPVGAENLAMGQVRDMNAYTVGALTKGWGYEFLYGGIVRDNEEEFQCQAKELLETVDCLVISGGSSVGAKDYTMDVIQSLGNPGVFVHGISIKPGKPTILSMAGKKPIIGLPGHPASALIIYQLFGKTILQALTGTITDSSLEKKDVKITKNVPSSSGRTDYIRVKLYKEGHDWWATPIIGKSGLISTLVDSDGIVEISSEKEGIVKGETVPVIIFT